MSTNTGPLRTAVLTLSLGALLVLTGLHFFLAHRVTVLEDTVIGLSKDQIRNMERFQMNENAVGATQQVQKDILDQMKRPRE